MFCFVCWFIDDNILVIKTYGGCRNQHWTIVGDWIQNRADRNHVLDIFNSYKREHASVGMKEWNGGANQQWEIEYL